MARFSSHVIVFFSLILGTFAVFAAPDGKVLFDEHCVVCHRSSGEGSLGLPLNKSKFKSLSDQYLIKTIRNGRPGRVMPAFAALSDSQVDAIVDYLREWSDSESFSDLDMQVAGNIENGKHLYQRHCTECHGADGKSRGKGTGQSYSRKRNFKVVPPAIGNSGFLASASDSMLKNVITNGREGTQMDAYGKLGLSDQDINDIVVYLRNEQSRLTADSRDGEEVSPEPTIIVESPHDFETTLKNLKQALSGHNFRNFPDRYLEQGLFPEWETNKKQITLRYCNFNNLYEMLKIDSRLGMALPCRISVVENDDGQVQLIAMNMARVASLFNNDQLQDVAKKMHLTQLEIMEEATF
ncbi:MAG: c-type cytochrome [Gammaproteobacteria bacterium]|nr:MAG: c-type cytochrome [Gammaproteobacteria bacterium]